MFFQKKPVAKIETPPTRKPSDFQVGEHYKTRDGDKVRVIAHMAHEGVWSDPNVLKCSDGLFRTVNGEEYEGGFSLADLILSTRIVKKPRLTKKKK